jgi:hypothetical protein
MVQVSPVKPIQWMRGVSKEYQRLVEEPEAAPAYSAVAL